MVKEVKELKKKSNEELLDELDRLRAELILLKSKPHGTLEKPSLIRNTKKRIARILTILGERGIRV
ncbi:MAG: 50S ribosomal protein L29 [Nitrososphaerota archaeon]|nr:50S ribosomal protein L29 [Candidatus Geocrenenecus dongiae]